MNLCSKTPVESYIIQNIHPHDIHPHASRSSTQEDEGVVLPSVRQRHQEITGAAPAAQAALLLPSSACLDMAGLPPCTSCTTHGTGKMLFHMYVCTFGHVALRVQDTWLTRLMSAATSSTPSLPMTSTCRWVRGGGQGRGPLRWLYSSVLAAWFCVCLHARLPGAQMACAPHWTLSDPGIVLGIDACSLCWLLLVLLVLPVAVG